MSARRLFFALWPDAVMREALAAAVRPSLSALRGGRPVPHESLHVTLAFLGAVPESSLGALRELASGLARGGAHIEASLDVTLDTLDYWRRSQILCAAASRAPEGAVELAEALRRALTAGGFAPDLKPFRAHVTLARQVRGAPPRLSMAPVTWSIGDFALIESRTGPEGAAYSVVESWPLSAGDDAVEGTASAPERP